MKLALFLCAVPALVQAQAPMDRFTPLIGTWNGAGWSVDAQGKRTEFTVTESVTAGVGGSVLLMQGKGADTATHAVTHDGLVLLYYDPATKTYRWHGHEIARPVMDAEAVTADGGVAWSIPAGAPGAVVRFTIRFGNGRWHEVGEFSADGKTWILFMEMNLTRDT